jgi:hypothetical protein
MVQLALGATAALLLSVTALRAQQPSVAADRAAAILVFPKIVVDTSNNAGRGRLDTLIRISNTSSEPVRLQCFWMNANGHCFNAPGIICDPTLSPRDPRCGGSFCVPGWQETDFIVQLTARQPVAWLASTGAVPCADSNDPAIPCFAVGTRDQRPSPNNNLESRVPAVLEDPFVGELKCIAVDQNDLPAEKNVLKGEALIVRSDAGNFDVRSYNAVGIPALLGRNNYDNVLVLGGNGAEYAGCPNVLVLDHFFDFAQDPVTQQPIETVLTLVPCTEDLLGQQPVTLPVQFLVFNEFEQRFSTSYRDFNCFREFRLSQIDTRSNPTYSIFYAGVAGTLTGQTRIRGVAGNDRTRGQTLLGVAEEFRGGGGSASFQLHMQGSRPQSDFVYLPLQ